MVYLLKGTKEAEIVKVSFEGTTDGYAVVERAEMIANFSSFSFAWKLKKKLKWIINN